MQLLTLADGDKPPAGSIPFKTKGRRRYPEVRKLILQAKASSTKVRSNAPTKVTKTRKTIQGALCTHPPCGIINVGNSCYLNAVLQCLFQVLTSTKAGDIQSSNDNALATVYSQWEDPSLQCIDPSPMKALLASLSPKFDNQKQQDSHECLMWILNIKEPPDMKVPPRLIRRLISSLKGLFSTVVVCDLCHGEYESEEDFSCVELDIPPSTIPTSLIQLISKFQEEEVIPLIRQRFCPLCSQVGPAVRKPSISSTGNWLMFSIKRFMKVGNVISKNKRYISYPLEDFSICNESYNLYCLVAHCGTRENGHYIAFIRSGLIWYKCDDSTITRVSRCEAANCNNNIYLLFYKKQAK